MSTSIEPERTQRNNESNSNELVLDGVLSSQPELGPSVPDGGYGWIVYLATVYFQFLIPSLITAFGIFLTESKVKNLTQQDISPKLWDDPLMYVPLFYSASLSFFDPVSRLIAHSTWPRLVAVAGVCLTCAGILFMWTGMTGTNSKTVFIASGLFTGLGSTIILSQCEILLAKYFRLKLTILSHITQAVTALGFVVTPIIIGHHLNHSSVLTITLWYQAIILQGILAVFVFKKPEYLKSQHHQETYNYISAHPDDEEDILSKNGRELQIKRQNSNGTAVTERHTIETQEQEAVFGPSTSSEANTSTKQNWENFEEDDHQEAGAKPKNWVPFVEEDDEEEFFSQPKETSKEKNWVEFNDDEDNELNDIKKSTRNLHLSFAEEKYLSENQPSTSAISGRPLPLFSDFPVNNNNSYAYDAIETNESLPGPAVFIPNQKRRKTLLDIEVFKQPTFYKSLLMVITTKFSTFIFYTLFPCYIYQLVPTIDLYSMSTLVGSISFGSLIFSGFSYWVSVDKRNRPMILFFLCWVGALGYFLIQYATTESAFIIGAVSIVVSIASLKHVGMPLLSLTIRGEVGREFTPLCQLSGLSFLIFLPLNFKYEDCFRLMGVLHFVTGIVWMGNFIYKCTRHIPGTR